LAREQKIILIVIRGSNTRKRHLNRDLSMRRKESQEDLRRAFQTENSKYKGPEDRRDLGKLEQWHED
jgi:hypothetical protein